MKIGQSSFNSCVIWKNNPRVTVTLMVTVTS